MKPRAPWIIALLLSLAANFALAGRWRAGAAVDKVAAAPVPKRSTPTAAAADARPVDPETWAQLDATGEPADFIALLRAKGYPPEVVRAILRIQIAERFADRTKAISAAIAAQPYWRGAWMGDPKISTAQRALRLEIRDQMRQLLGPGFDTATEVERATLVRRYGDLPPEKLNALQQIATDYVEMMSEIRTAARSANNSMSVLLPEDREKLTLLEKEQRADVVKLLSPAELEVYDLRTGRTAGYLRDQLAGFEPTEQEFLAIYRLQKPVDDRFAVETGTAAQRLERENAQKEIPAQIAAALGPERYAEYQRKTDVSWRNNSRFVTQYSLPAPTTDQLFIIQKDLTERANTLRQGNPPYEQLATQLTALENEARTRLMPLLGDRLFEGYRNNYGYWVRNLQPPPRPAPKP